jgi:thioredoxin-related protein
MINSPTLVARKREKQMSKHPHFDDKGGLSWHTDFKSALQEAQKTKKKLFIDSGRRACGNCRVLVENIIPRPEVKALLSEHFILYADDCDEMAPEVQELGIEYMRHATTLPFMIITDSEGEWIDGASGAINADRFLALLQSTIQK